MEVYWFEQIMGGVAAGDEWLCRDEQLVLAGMKVPKRRADWRLGRWTAKLAVAAYLDLPSESKHLTSIEIRPAATGAPEVFLDHQPASVSISLSHRDGLAACVVAPPGSVVGCDLEVVEPHSDAFISDYFTTEEQELCAQATLRERDRLVATIWSAKESALKALRTGLRVDTRSVSATISPDSSNAITVNETGSAMAGEWHRLSVRYEDRKVFSGWWQCTDRLVRTFVSEPHADPPISLLNSHLSSAKKK